MAYENHSVVHRENSATLNSLDYVWVCVGLILIARNKSCNYEAHIVYDVRDINNCVEWISVTDVGGCFIIETSGCVWGERLLDKLESVDLSRPPWLLTLIVSDADIMPGVKHGKHKSLFFFFSFYCQALIGC